MYVYVCVCVYTEYALARVIHTHTLSTCIHIHIHVHMLCTHYTHMNTYTHARTHTYLQTKMPTHKLFINCSLTRIKIFPQKRAKEIQRRRDTRQRLTAVWRIVSEVSQESFLKYLDKFFECLNTFFRTF